MKSGNEKNNPTSTIAQLLLALLPYTNQNLKLVFKPDQFFNELDKTSGHSSTALRATFRRAKKRKLISIKNDGLSISLQGRHIIQPFIAKHLTKNGQLMVIFDIPEDFANRRKKLRTLLQQLKFKQIQRSVWMSDMDHRIILSESIEYYSLQDWVQLYESARIL